MTNDEGAWRQALFAAADMIEARGWTYAGSDARTTGAVSMVTAVATVCIFSKPYERALKELRLTVGMRPNDWDMVPGRTQRDVIAALRVCASRPDPETPPDIPLPVAPVQPPRDRLALGFSIAALVISIAGVAIEILHVTPSP